VCGARCSIASFRKIVVGCPSATPLRKCAMMMLFEALFLKVLPRASQPSQMYAMPRSCAFLSKHTSHIGVVAERYHHEAFVDLQGIQRAPKLFP